MSRSRRRVALMGAAALAVAWSVTGSATEPAGYPATYGFGSAPTEAELKTFLSIQPDGRGLPPGQGGYDAGKKIFAEACSSCHGDALQGVPKAGLGGDRLIGGRGSLASDPPIKTVESYWPYATTLFDYIKRAMPLTAPGSLSNDDVYALASYILTEAKVTQKADIMSAATLPKVAMPNKDGFFPDPRPELDLYR